MPVYSSSLGCLDAQHLYMGDTNTYVVPMDPNRFDHSVDFHGAAVGTLVIAQGKQGSNEVRFKMSVRTDDEDLLSEVSVTYPPHEEIESGKAHSRIQLSTPPSLGSSCMRYDATLYIPPNLKKLHIQAHSIAHIRFDDSAQIDLEKLFITLYTTNKNNMILPNAGIRANEMSLEMIRGWLVGELNLVNSTVISTQRGDATTNLRVLPISTGYDPIPAVFESITGAGRTDLFYITDHGAPHRPIDSTHRSSRNGNLYLTYKDAEFSGQVKLKVKSYTAFGLQGSVNGPNKDIEPPWYGHKNGKDRLNIQSVNGWVGLYFQ